MQGVQERLHAKRITAISVDGWLRCQHVSHKRRPRRQMHTSVNLSILAGICSVPVVTQQLKHLTKFEVMQKAWVISCSKFVFHVGMIPFSDRSTAALSDE